MHRIPWFLIAAIGTMPSASSFGADGTIPLIHGDGNDGMAITMQPREFRWTDSVYTRPYGPLTRPGTRARRAWKHRRRTSGRGGKR